MNTESHSIISCMYHQASVHSSALEIKAGVRRPATGLEAINNTWSILLYSTHIHEIASPSRVQVVLVGVKSGLQFMVTMLPLCVASQFKA